MKSLALILTLCSTVLLTGCWDNKNIQDLLYTTAIGIDYKNKVFEVYIQIVSFGSVAKSETSGGESGPQVYVGKGSGKTISLALGNLYETVQKKIYWSHVRTYLLTESAMQSGGEEYFDNLKRYREFRYTPWIFGTKGSIEDIFLTHSFFQMSPITNILGQPEDNYQQSSFIKPLQAQEYQINLNEPGETAIVPTITVDKTTWRSDKNPQENKLRINGVFIVRKNSFQGWMPNNQLNGLRWMEKDTYRSPVEIKPAIISLEKPKSKITVTKFEGKTVFNVEVKVTGNIVELLDSHPSEEEMEEEAAEQIKKEIRATYEEGLRIDADLYNFRNVLFKKKMGNWQDIELTSSSLNQINVHVHIQHTGELKKEL